GMSGILYRGDVNAGLDHQSIIHFDQVAVSVDTPEVRKNELLCTAILGRNLKLPAPRIKPQRYQKEAAETRLKQLGLTPGNFWISCAGHDQYTAIRNWSAENWARALSHAVSKHGWRILFIGTGDEDEVTQKIRTLMGQAADATESICSAPESL